MLSWASERRLSNSKELRNVDMFVYVWPSGFIGRFLGRTLRLRVDRFTYVVDRNNTLRRVEVAADSLTPESEVNHKTRQERLPLNFSEVERVARRTRSAVLNAPRYPSIDFEVDAETAADVSGTLHLRGESHPLRCTKTIDGSELVVDCPVSMKQFRVPPYVLWLGLFSESDQVLVQTRVPASALSL